MTNYERIKNWSIEEVADSLIIYRHWLDNKCYVTPAGEFYTWKEAFYNTLKWLEKESDNDEN